MAKYPIPKTFQISEEMQKSLEDLEEINVAAVCRKALQAEIDLRKRKP